MKLSLTNSSDGSYLLVRKERWWPYLRSVGDRFMYIPSCSHHLSPILIPQWKSALNLGSVDYLYYNNLAHFHLVYWLWEKGHKV